MRRLLFSIFFFTLLALPARAADLPLTSTPDRLSPGNPSFETQFTLPDAGESWLLLTASSPDLSWADPKKKHAVLSISADGAPPVDIILFGGPEPITYSAWIGDLARGAHTLRVAVDGEKTIVKSPAILITSASVRYVPSSDPDYDIARFSPVVHPRTPHADTDIPLYLTCDKLNAPETVTLTYTLYMSNEDGGTGVIPSILMTQYGRVTDIEWIYQIIYRKSDLAVFSETYQGSSHHTKKFQGGRLGNHPILHIATDNGNFEPVGLSSVRTAFFPEHFPFAGTTREHFMDINFWMYRVMNEELLSENKITRKPAPYRPVMRDARNYLYLDIRADNHTDGRHFRIEVQTTGQKRWNSSEPEMTMPVPKGSGLLAWRGLYRTTVELPAGSTCADITGVRLNGDDSVDYEVTYVSGFLLDSEYRPGPPCATFQGNARVTAANRPLDISFR